MTPEEVVAKIRREFEEACASVNQQLFTTESIREVLVEVLQNNHELIAPPMPPLNIRTEDKGVTWTFEVPVTMKCSRCEHTSFCHDETSCTSGVPFCDCTGFQP